ncbi:MAG: molybdopterin oxidoreductase, partial [Bdellovibrionales bacterium]|nr:molybdopterin oxidoreductase [Bdellovibrionales bacterium]
MATKISNPGKLTGVGGLKTLFLILTVVGLAAFGGALMVNKQRAWASFLQGHFYFAALAIGGLFFAAIQWLTGAMWSAPVRRIAESYTAYLPFVLLGLVGIGFGMHELYVWTHADHVQGDIILEHKAGYLNTKFFMIRNVIAIGIWFFFARKLIGNSTKQDTASDASPTLTNRSWSPIFLILFALTFTMMSFDLLMSLDPHWFSTMFGVYCFAGMFYTILALTAILTVWLRRRGLLKDIVNENHLHDLGKFMFA